MRLTRHLPRAGSHLGTRLPVHQVARLFANGDGDGVDGLLRSSPSIGREDIFSCRDDAAWLAEEQVTPLDDWIVVR